MPPEAHARASAIYAGRVFHRRTAPRRHDLNYDIFYLLLDLDEAPALARDTAWFGYNSAAWFSFHDRDHGAADGRPYRSWLDETLRAGGFSDAPYRYRVLCLPRVLGYQFNPITVVYCHAADDRLCAMLYEVNNTFGERRTYLMPVSGNGAIRQRCDKALFVSPFFDMQGHYEFRLDRPGDALGLCIDYHHEHEHRLRAMFHGRRLPFSGASLRRLAWRYPAATLKVIAGIHFEALKLWLKGVPLVRHVATRNTTVTMGTEQ